MRNTLAIMCCLCLLLFATVPAMADEWDKKTTVTFGQPVEIPGLVLQPGTYVFKLLRSSNDRHIVLVYNADEDYLYAMILAINNYRVTPTSDPVMKFEERAKGAPQALKGWFWPGDTWGQEFVYPNAQATAIAEATKEPVLSAEVKPAEKAEELIQAPVAEVSPAPAPIEIAEATPPPAPVAAAPAAEPPAPEPVPAPAEELPKTASPLPLIGLAGGFLLALGSLLRWLPRHISNT